LRKALCHAVNKFWSSDFGALELRSSRFGAYIIAFYASIAALCALDAGLGAFYMDLCNWKPEQAYYYLLRKTSILGLYFDDIINFI
jgi:hypothetical protein